MLSRLVSPHAVSSLRTGVRSMSYLTTVGENVFSDAVRKEMLSEAVYTEYNNSIATGADMSKEATKEIARAMFDWSTAKGAVNFSHIFYPMRGMKAGMKTDGFVSLNWGDEKPLKDITVGFEPSMLWMSETDGSSFPNGGLRATHTAAAYMIADKSSNPYIKDDVLYIPSSFISWNGDALDYKTPLLRSQEAVNKQATRLMHHLGFDDVKEVYTNIGCEQEYFAIPSELAAARPDLVSGGRTVLGAAPARGQQLSDHYFGRMNPRVKAFQQEFQDAALKTGISHVVYHNEVAPSQHEWSPIFSLANVAADQNILACDLMKEIGAKHGLTILCHEKPFAGINGSGKHVNWGLNTDTGMNLYTTGKTPEEEAVFVSFVSAVAHGVGNYAEALRASVGGAGNDHRLGAQEAPPAIFSLYLGQKLGAHIQGIADGNKLDGYNAGRYGDTVIETGARATGRVGGGTEDRNRTAPLPFCGNRFEFRAVGSDANVSFSVTVMNTIVAEGCAAMSDLIESGTPVRDAVGNTLAENMKVIFNGDGYSDEWHQEAMNERGLPNLQTTVDALDQFTSDKNRALFSKHGVYSERELEAVQSVMYERYALDIEIEADTMLDMVNQGVLPAAAADLKSYDGTALAGSRPAVYGALADASAALQAHRDAWPMDDEAEAATYAKEVIKPSMAAVREAHDMAERLIESNLYPFPTYHEMIHPHHDEPSDFSRSL
jgi:glutamine synthetase